MGAYWNLYQLKDFKVYFHLKRIEYEAKEMVGITEGLRCFNPLLPLQSQYVVDALSWKLFGN